jgi:hypothetical protein
MEIIDMVITRIRFSGRKSRRVNNSLQRPDLALQKSVSPTDPPFHGPGPKGPHGPAKTNKTNYGNDIWKCVINHLYEYIINN